MTTQYANASYQEVIDLHTESDRVSIVGIHTPCSDTPYRMLRGFWEQFKKFKYNGCSISLVPSAQLPVDPLQVSYEAGEPTIDPRDMLNPILFHGCHGDDMGIILNTLYTEDTGTLGQLIQVQKADSAEHNMLVDTAGLPLTDGMFESLYYRAMTDRTWLKAHPQRGFRKSGLHPMVYSLASSVQLNPQGNEYGVNPSIVEHDDDGISDRGLHGSFGNSSSSANMSVAGSFGRPTLTNTTGGLRYTMPLSRTATNFFTPRLQRLGWMDTRQFVGLTSSDAINTPSGSSTPEDLAGLFVQAQKLTEPVFTPKLYMGMIMLPPAYKTEQHFRLIINHNYSFAKFRGASMQYHDVGEVMNAYNIFDFTGPTNRSVDFKIPEVDEDDTKDIE